MTFRIKLRLKSLNPHYPRKPAPNTARFPDIQTDPYLLKRLKDAINQPVQHDWRYPIRWGYADRIGKQTAWN
jgi:hypothetical protein